MVDKAILIIWGIIGLAIAFVFFKLFKNPDLINPASQNNLVNKAAQGIYGGGSDKAGTIGTDIYDAFHNGDGSLKLPWQDSKPISGTAQSYNVPETEKRMTIMPINPNPTKQNANVGAPFKQQPYSTDWLSLLGEPSDMSTHGGI